MLSLNQAGYRAILVFTVLDGLMRTAYVFLYSELFLRHVFVLLINE